MPRVSVVILNWNGKKHLGTCLRSLLRVHYKPLEIILVDNNSIDGSPEYVKKKFPGVKLLALDKNVGFAEGNNRGFRVSHGKYVLFLNNDTILPPDFFEPLVMALEKDAAIGCIQPQIRLMKERNKLDQVGSYLTSTGFLYHVGFKKSWNSPLYRKERNIFSAKGACMLIRRKVMEHVGLFDSDYFIFFEESDLCHRIWLLGYRVTYSPKTYIYHLAGGDTAETFAYTQRLYLSLRNMICTYLKNFGFWNMATIFPVLIVVHGLLILNYSFRLRFDLVWMIVLAYGWNVAHVRATLEKRARVQNYRTISDMQLNSKVLRNPRLSYYYYLLTDLRQFRDDLN